jgi:hypothetical protein
MDEWEADFLAFDCVLYGMFEIVCDCYLYNTTVANIQLGTKCKRLNIFDNTLRSKHRMKYYKQ